MMTNLFSNFDPSTNLILPLNWLSTFLGMFFIPPMFWLIPSRVNFIWTKMITTLHVEFSMLINNNKLKGMTLMFISLMSIILYNNFLGLFPYIFTSSSHLVMTLSLSLPLWLSFMIYGWLNNSIHMFAHLMPQGTPPILMPFMVCIETIGNMIRPGTLAVRLTANMIAGHLLLTLLGNIGPSTTSFMIINLVIITQMMILILELAVSMIQSYVFAMLSVLYSSEVN
uniref:ATP synthase subunit a n=1 Tax=Trapezodirus sp. 1 EF-2015 TaxID=1756866 RepID=A0A0S2M9E1_9COLE|nr:ATP synthase F0 subunit 6 [Trapezodirus sp. 1 EF-2015]